MLRGLKKGRWVLGRKPDTESHPSQAAGRDAWAFGLALVTGPAPSRHGPADSDSPEFTEGRRVLGSIRGPLPGPPCLPHGPPLHLLPLLIPGPVPAFSPLPG